MKAFYSFIAILILVLFAQSAEGQVTVTGCTGSGNGCYATLSAAATAIVAAQPLANIVITITGNTSEPVGGATLVAGTWTTMTIQPSGGSWTISAAITAGSALIFFNGADNVTINGLNSGGNYLTFSNTTVSATSGTSTIKLAADATNNTITNCSILGSGIATLATNGGNIFISTGTTTGNDNITISNCKIGPAGTNLPSKGIYGNGSTTNATIANSNVTINNCEIYDYFLTTGCAGIYALTGNTDWTITNNKIYQTATRTFTAAGTMSGIYFANSAYGDNIQITGNTIGYASNSGTGTLTLTGSGFAGKFQGILLNAMPTAATACSINTNIISDISLTSSTGTFYGINNATAAGSNTINININQVKNIGIITSTGEVAGIYAGSATELNCNTNMIENISRDAAGYFNGIKYYTPATANFIGNTIRNLSSSSTSSTSGFYGIYSGNAAVNENIIGNYIYNLTSSSTAAQYIYAISCGTANGIKKVQSNKVYNISAAGGATIYGINVTYGSAVEISNNDISAFSGTLYLYGIYQYASAGTANIFENVVYNLSSTNTSATINGFFNANATTTNIYNNFLSDFTATNSNSSVAIEGFYIYSGTTVNLFYNTVYLKAVSSGTTFGTACVFSFTAPTIDMRNNILVNLSTANGSGFTCAYRRNGSTLTTYSVNSNNNCFYAGVPGTNNLILYNGSSYSTIADYKTAVSPRDAASFSENPPFENISSMPYDFHIQAGAYTQCESGGTPITSPITITDDYDGNTRDGSTPDVGADEGCFTASAVWLGITSNVWSTATNWGSGTAAPVSSQNVLINKTGSFSPVISGSTTVAGLFIKEANMLTLNASQTLTVNGNFTNNGTFTDNGGTTVLSGSSVQNISGSGAKTFNNLTINNTNGVSLSGNISVSGTLSLSNSILDLNHYNISLGTTGTLAETGTAIIKQTDVTEPFGTISATRTLNEPLGTDVAGLGVTITSSANLGSTTIIRGVERRECNGNLGIARYYDISPSNNTGLNATVVYRYNASELGGGIHEGDLLIFKSTDNGITWTQMTGTLNTENKTITVTGVNDFSIWTFGDKNAPLPVELLSFTANVNAKNIALNWTTLSEINNAGFNIERIQSSSAPPQRVFDKKDGGPSGSQNWEKIGFVSGHGTVNNPTNYSFEDRKLQTGKYKYRLKQIDVNGNFEYFALNREVEIGVPVKFELSQNYPNPFNPATNIDFELPFDGKVYIVIFDITGREVKTLLNESRTAGFHTIRFNASDLSSGLYFYRIIVRSAEKDFIATKKMAVIK